MYQDIIEKYFSSQNKADKAAVLALFSPDAVVHNVNMPPFEGAAALEKFCDDLYARTSKREFQVIEVVERGTIAMAEWKGELDFREGATVGPWVLKSGFSVSIRGINKFEFDRETRKIKVLRIYHETTTVGQLAQKSSQ